MCGSGRGAEPSGEKRLRLIQDPLDMHTLYRNRAQIVMSGDAEFLCRVSPAARTTDYDSRSETFPARCASKIQIVCPLVTCQPAAFSWILRSMRAEIDRNIQSNSS